MLYVRFDMNFKVSFQLKLRFKELCIISCWPMFVSHDVPLKSFDKLFPRFSSKSFLQDREESLIQEATLNRTSYDRQ